MRLSECTTITRVINDARDTMNMTIDFGTENCTSADGRERRGKILITRIGDHYWDGAFEVTHTFENYYVTNNKVNGTKVVNGYINGDGNRVHAMVDNDLTSTLYVAVEEKGIYKTSARPENQARLSILKGSTRENNELIMTLRV